MHFVIIIVYTYQQYLYSYIQIINIIYYITGVVSEKTEETPEPPNILINMEEPKCKNNVILLYYNTLIHIKKNCL